MVTRRAVWGFALGLLTALWLGGCELEDVTVTGGESLMVVAAVMRPDEEYQFVIVEQSLDGTVERPDSAEFPVPPHSPRIPVANALVTVANLDLPADTCGGAVPFRDTPYRPQTPTAPGVYWAPGGCPTMRPGDRLQLRVETPDGQVVTGVTRVPGMNAAFLARGSDSVAMGGRDSVMTFNRDRDTLRFGVDPIVGRLLQLDVRRNGDLTDLGTKVQVDTTEFVLAGNAVNVFVSGAGNDVFRGGRNYSLTLTLSDTNYFDFSRSSNNEFTGRGFINRLTGGIGVFGSAVSATSRVWVVADVHDPREGPYRLIGEIEDGDVPIDAALRVYLHRQTETSEASAFIEGAWFTENPAWGTFNGMFPAPRWISKDVAGKSVDGEFTGERLRLTIPDTLINGFVRYSRLDGIFAAAADSFVALLADSSFTGFLAIDTLLVVRQNVP